MCQQVQIPMNTSPIILTGAGSLDILAVPILLSTSHRRPRTTKLIVDPKGPIPKIFWYLVMFTDLIAPWEYPKS